jgi:D-alanine-D-alanine ligase
MSQPRVLILFNEPTLPADHPDAESEHDILYTADCVAGVLAESGVSVARLGVTDDPAAVLAGIKAAAPDAVFNLYEGTAKWGNTEAFVGGMLELLRVPFTGSPTQPLLLARSKPLTKQLLAGAGLPTAGFLVVDALPVPPCPLPWPVIVKPGKEDASVGIDQNSVVTSQEQLAARVGYIIGRYGPPVLVERFVRGREFNVAVWDRGDGPRTLPFSEILFLEQEGDAPLWPIVSFDAKWHPHTRDFKATPAKNPAEVTPELEAAVSALAVRAFEQVGCRDYARIDFRVDESGRPYILEVNPNPCISPLAGLAAALETADIPYAEFVRSLVRSALRRGPRPELADAVGTGATAASGPDVAPAAARRAWKVRPARPDDADDLVELLDAADAMTADERKAAARAVRSRSRRKDWGGARVLVLAGRTRIGGFAVAVPGNPVHGTFTLETLLVDPSLRRAGHGRALAAALEADAATAGGRWLLADLPSGPAAAPARQFLTAAGFGPAGEVPGFYPEGWARLAFAKPLPDPAAAPAAAPAVAPTAVG